MNNMDNAIFQPSLFPNAPFTITEDPYVLVEIYAKDPTNIISSDFITWEKSDTTIWQGRIEGTDCVGLHGGRSLSHAYLTKEIYINESGLYWVLIRSRRVPYNGGKSIGLSIDNVTKGNISSYSPWDHYRYLDYGYMHISKGTHYFRVDLNGKDSWVDHIILYKLDYFSTEEKGIKRLNYSKIEFTENAIGELNTADVTVALLEDWNKPNRNIYSRKVFDYADVFNICVGPSPHESKVKFGGYLIGWEESDDSTEITFNAIDRLSDLYNRPTYANYYIGVAPSGETDSFPQIQSASGLEAIRHANETCEYGLLSYGIEYPYGLYRDFRLKEHFDTVNVAGFIKTLSPSMGLRLGYDKIDVNSCGVNTNRYCSAVLFENKGNPVDISKNGIFAIKYFASGESCGFNTRVQFNIKISMYREGEGPNDATDYILLFSGKPGYSKVIGQLIPVLNGKIQIGKFNLKQAFDQIVPSTNYYVTKIELVDLVSDEQVNKRQKTSFNILEIIFEPPEVNTKLKLEQATSYPYENIVEIINKMGYVAWVDYGKRRAEDVLCMAPEMNTQSPVIAQEGVNVLDVTDKTYAPRESLRNRKKSHYHYQEGDDEKTGISFVENRDSVIRYGPGAREEYEDQTEINNLTDADIENRKFIEQNSYPMHSFTLVMRGTPNLNPSQYIISNLNGSYLNGRYSTKTVTHSITPEEGYITRISVNRPGSYYNMMMDKIEKKIEIYREIQSIMTYSRNSLKNMGFNSIGAFIRSGY